MKLARLVTALTALGASSGAGAAEPLSSAPVFARYVLDSARPEPPPSTTIKQTSQCRGAGTVLEIAQTRMAIPRHDVDLGQTAITLRDDAGRVLVQTRVTELWNCLTYDARTHRYLLTSTNEHGVKVTMRGFVYLDEAHHDFIDSVLATQSFEAVAALSSPQGRWLALVGQISDGRSRRSKLYALDLDADSLRVLGAPPAPPPIEKEWWKERDMLFAWEAPERHYTELDKGIWSFDDELTLRVSYGNDTYKARAKRRSARTFELSKKDAP